MPEPIRSIDAPSSRYQPLFELAAGGMGRVSVARLRGTAGFQRLVALKTIHPFLASEPRFQEMFFDEARLAAGIHHPNVVPVLDLGELDDTYFLTMEYVPGESLSNVMIACHDSGQRIPYGIAVRWIVDACAGLHAAHELRDPQSRLLNVIHRDISPSNLLVTEHGSCKLTDFGIAKALATRSDTTAGALKGKVGYLSPEQVLNSKPDRRSDIFSLGIILFEVTTLRKLFGSPSHVQTLEDIVRGKLPDPRDLAPDYPAPLAEIVRKALTRDRTQRYQTAEEMGAALERVARDFPTPMVASDVAAWMRAHFEPLFDLRRRKIAVAIEAADQEEKSGLKQAPGARAKAPAATPVVSILASSSPASTPSPIAGGATRTATAIPIRAAEEDEAEIRTNTVTGIVAPPSDHTQEVSIDDIMSVAKTDRSLPRVTAIDPSEDFDTATTVMPQNSPSARVPALAQVMNVANAANGHAPAVAPVPSVDASAAPAMPMTPSQGDYGSALGSSPLGFAPSPFAAHLATPSQTGLDTLSPRRPPWVRWAIYGVVVLVTFVVTAVVVASHGSEAGQASTPPTVSAPATPAMVPSTTTGASPVTPTNPAPTGATGLAPVPVAAPQNIAPQRVPTIAPPIVPSQPEPRSSSRRSSHSTPAHRSSGGTVSRPPDPHHGGTFRPAEP